MRGGAFLAVFIAALTPFLVIFLLVFGSTQGFVAWRPPVLWTAEFGDPNLASGSSSIATSNDGVYVAGVVNYTISFPGYNATFIPFLSKYKADGSVAWTDTIKKISQFTFTEIAGGIDGVYGLGGASKNASLLKYDLNGNQLWVRTLNRGVILSAISSSADGFYVAGSSDRPMTNQNFTGSNILFLRRYDSSGSLVWTDEFSNSSDYVLGLYAGASGVFVLTSLSIVGYSPAGLELWRRQVGAPQTIAPLSISADATGIYLADTVSQCGICPQAAFLSKYNFSGNLVWNVTFENPDRSEPAGILLAADSSGVLLSTSGSNGFVEKYDGNGNSVWSMKTPLFPLAGLTSRSNFLISAGSGQFYIGGSVKASQGDVGLVQSFGSSPSLVFFGVNPPISFALFGTLIAVAVLSVFLLWRRRVRIMSKHPKSAAPDRYRKPGDTIAD